MTENSITKVDDSEHYGTGVTVERALSPTGLPSLYLGRNNIGLLKKQNL